MVVAANQNPPIEPPRLIVSERSPHMSSESQKRLDALKKKQEQEQRKLAKFVGELAKTMSTPRIAKAPHSDKPEVYVSYDMSLTPQFKRNLDFLKVSRGESPVQGYQQEAKLHDFGANPLPESVVWTPANREEWLACCDEMSSLCQEAALRSAVLLKNKSNRRLDAPLTRAYIHDRIDIDDPLRGYQIRHTTGGWLQGFIMMTNFTTWTNYFKWDSKHPQSGMVTTSKAIRENQVWDWTGDLAEELESQYRSGDPFGAGVIWHDIAEISLVGGLGCGEYLMRMALDDIVKRGYKYIVLQATTSSFSFYQRFGFTRVGAVTRYDSNLRKVVGYRHWTYADERHLGHHGGPSYMMALRVEDMKKSDFSFLEAVKPNMVEEKPVVKKLELTKPFPYAEEIFKRQIEDMNHLAKTFDYKKNSVILSKSFDEEIDGRQKKRQKMSEEANDNSLVSSTTLIVRSKRGAAEVTPNTHVPAKDQAPEKKEDLKWKKQRANYSNRDPSLPRFYNKVVTPKDSKGSAYYFVVYYDEHETIDIVKLEQRGTFKAGTRIGRKKYRAPQGLNDSHITRKSIADFEIVPSVVVTRVPAIEDESWDIEGS